MLVYLFFTLVSSGSSPLSPVAITPGQIQEVISEGDVVRVGDAVSLTLTKEGGETHPIEVTDVTQDEIFGEGVAIAVDDMAAV